MKTNKTKSAMTALVIAAMLCTAAMPVKAADSQWVKTDGTWSYVKEDGSKATGWIKDGGCWYAFDTDGAMRTGWIASNEHWYFMGESGVMQSDAWVEDNGAKYYIKGTGVMAKDYVKDGYELTSEGKAIPLGESGSVVVTDPAELEGKVIEGNLYVDVTTAKELELKGVTVKGKLVVLGDNETAGKVTLTDSKVETINTQTRNAEVVLSGKTEVKNVVIEETAKVTPDKNYKGEVENIEVQSTTKGEVVIDVPADNVSTRTYATVDVKAPVGNLEVKTDTQVKVNADVKNVIVTETAKDTTVEVSKGNTVGTITADAPVKIDGKGTVDKVEANVDGVEASKDTTIKDVETGKDVTEAPDVTKPDKGGSSGGSGGGDYTPTPSADYEVKDKDTLVKALNDVKDGQVIKLTESFDVDKQINVENKASFTIDGNYKTITFNKASKNQWDEKNAFVLSFYNSASQITVKNIKLTGGNAGMLVNGANVKLEGNIDVSGNGFGGINVDKGTGVSQNAILDVRNATLVNDSEAADNPTIFSEVNKDSDINHKDNQLYIGTNRGTKGNQNHYFINSIYADTKVELTIDGTNNEFKERSTDYNIENGLIKGLNSADNLECFTISMKLTQGQSKMIRVEGEISESSNADDLILAVQEGNQFYDAMKANFGGDGFEIPSEATATFYVIGKAGTYEGTFKIVDVKTGEEYCKKDLTITIVKDESTNTQEPTKDLLKVDTVKTIQVEENTEE